ncbi:hypothetical protein [Dongia sp.]|uniref:hypothetical protein n=1 Tax=Dongia sp. TaxID=1977262 RepID=UPI0035AF0F91
MAGIDLVLRHDGKQRFTDGVISNAERILSVVKDAGTGFGIRRQGLRQRRKETEQHND